MNYIFWFLGVSFLVGALYVTIAKRLSRHPQRLYVYLQKKGEQYRFVGGNLRGELLTKNGKPLVTDYFIPFGRKITQDEINKAEIYFKDEWKNGEVIVMVKPHSVK